MTLNLTDEDGEFLVKLARRSIEEYLRRRVKVKPSAETPESLNVKRGVFVTLNSLVAGVKELRGCIGFPYPTHPLVEATVESAIEAAVGDPRFPPVTLKEMDSIVVEVSVLTRPELIVVNNPRELPKSIRIGVDGLIIERGLYKGLLLPQVPVEWGWDEEEFLSNACMKAGLTPDSWLLKDIKVYKFQAEIFEEEEPRGQVKRRILR
ncbi:TIGR00296 family protein [Candidatus Bathyarchaeota archaeon]|nr:TIGR00296 family protein [Candidatus Bathyarchaeota archaeon]MBS7613067.1 TIGR00296 family protein [Candidatus Bathyarchaeota archaeon]MBS7618423.1 TIGR00296 family protein [Candidatus Bathyarchaeota archaeon]